MPQAPLTATPPRRQLSAICELVLNCLHQQKGEEGVRREASLVAWQSVCQF